MTRIRRLRLALACLTLGAAAVAAPDPGRGQSQVPLERQAFLSWNAPHGSPGASDRLTVACDDTARVDTLYITYRPGGYPRTELNAFEAILYFHPEPGDTLLPFWFFQRDWPNAGALLVDVDRGGGGFPCQAPWTKLEDGKVAYDHRSGRGRLDLSFKTVGRPGIGLSHEVDYCLARVTIRHRRADLPGCGQPVCVELGRLLIKSGDHSMIEVTRGQRVVTWNGGSCRSVQGGKPTRAWRPDVPLGETPATFVPPKVDLDSLRRAGSPRKDGR